MVKFKKGKFWLNLCDKFRLVFRNLTFQILMMYYSLIVMIEK